MKPWYGWAFGGLVLVGFLASLWIERRPSTSPEQAEAHGQTIVHEQIAAKAETVYVERKVEVQAARDAFRVSRDTVLTHLTDTLLVKETLARADTAILKDSIALAQADTLIAAEKAVTASVKNELAIALRPRYSPRLSVAVAGLYEPLTGVPVTSGDVGFRVIRGLSLMARAEQRVVAGERPRLAVGLSYRL